MYLYMWISYKGIMLWTDVWLCSLLVVYGQKLVHVLPKTLGFYVLSYFAALMTYLILCVMVLFIGHLLNKFHQVQLEMCLFWLHFITRGKKRFKRILSKDGWVFSVEEKIGAFPWQLDNSFISPLLHILYVKGKESLHSEDVGYNVTL